MASMTKGYSYAFQVLGYLYWNKLGILGYTIRALSFQKVKTY